MPISPDFALSKIKSLGFPAVFGRIWDGEMPESLYGLCQRPKRFFEYLPELVRVFPRIEQCLPLWEENRELAYALDLDNGEFIQYYYGDAYCTALGHTYQQFVTAFFMNLVYAGIDDILDELAEIFSYRHLAELKEWAALPDDGEPRFAFVDTIRD